MEHYSADNIADFLVQSNEIEDEHSIQAHDDAALAWNYAFQNRKKITVDVILEIHRLLLHELNPNIAGKIRQCDVRIGNSIKYFISIPLIKSDLERVIKMMKFKQPGAIDQELEAYARHCHVQFEQIHPFEDGNGRTGRILYNIQRFNLGLPIHIIQADAYCDGDNEQQNYYNWFRN